MSRLLLALPLAVIGVAAALVPTPAAQPATGGPGVADAPLEYQRRTRGEWESFSCACGHLLQLSPIFAASEVRCPNCARITRVA